MARLNRARHGSSSRGSGQRLPVATELSNRYSGVHPADGLQRCEWVANLRQAKALVEQPAGVRAVSSDPTATTSAATVTGQYHHRIKNGVIHMYLHEALGQHNYEERLQEAHRYRLVSQARALSRAQRRLVRAQRQMSRARARAGRIRLELEAEI